MNELIYNLAIWLDDTEWSRMLHESYYMYNWVESTHVLTLMVSLGILFLIDLRMLGLALPDIPASRIAERLSVPMLVGFAVMFSTGILLFYAVPVRTSQSLWFRIKMVLLVACAVNALLIHKRMNESITTWDIEPRAPGRLRLGAMLSLAFWSIVVVCGRFIAYDWFDCHKELPYAMYWAAGCVDEMASFASE